MSDEPSGLEVAVNDPDGGMVLRWALVAEVIEADGTETLRTHASEGMAQWTRLGMLEYAAATIRASLVSDEC